MQENKTTMAEIVARNSTKHASNCDVEICTTTKLVRFKKGTEFIADDNAIHAICKGGIRVGERFILGDFKVYSV